MKKQMSVFLSMVMAASTLSAITVPVQAGETEAAKTTVTIMTRSAGEDGLAKVYESQINEFMK